MATLRAVVGSAQTRVTLSGAADGEVVEVAGTVVAGSSLTSPVQGLPCVWWRVEVVIFRPPNVRLKTQSAVDVCSDADFTIRTVDGDTRGGARQPTGQGVRGAAGSDGMGSQSFDEPILGPWLVGTQQHPVVIETTATAKRRTMAAAIAAVQIVVGVGMLAVAYVFGA